RCSHHGGHGATTPIRLRKPVADFRSMGFPDLKAVEPAAADQESILVSDRPMHWLTLLLCGLFDYPQPRQVIGLGVWKRNAERVVGDFFLLEVFDARSLVGRLEFRKVNSVGHADSHGLSLVSFHPGKTLVSEQMFVIGVARRHRFNR